ncbi:Flp pilus assembly protein CpaB [Palleronia sp.]|uniref:Flp pilus assembly protein CpaB n=1 Tax=Palleronia sp. TaxID=1940284 RepID=UPI0035C85ABA
MRIVFAAVLLAGLGLAGLAVILAKDYVSTLKAGQSSVVPMTKVIALKADVAYGEPLARDDLKFIELPSAVVPAGAFTEVDAMFPKGYDVPRTVLRAMAANEPVLASKVTAPGEDAGVATRLSTGMRAFAIRVDVASGVSGFLRPNDRVDIFWSGALPGRNGEVTRLIDTNVRIVAVDQSVDAERTKAVVARTITVEATPRQVASFAQAQSSGRLSLALVGALDESVSEMVEIDQRELLGIEDEPVVAAAPAPQTCSIRTRRGSEVVEMPIPCTN